MTTEFKPGQKVPKSGIYKVTHDNSHNGIEHEITAIEGKVFPPCHGCGQNPRFVLVREAHHIETHTYFK